MGQILIEVETQREQGKIAHLFHNRPAARTIYTPVSQRLLPLDDVWRRDLALLASQREIGPRS